MSQTCPGFTGTPAFAKRIQRGKTMTRNVGQTERLIRIVAGLGLLYLAATGQYTPWTWLGVVPLLTGLIGWCPPYALFGINTCKTR
jgi:hypothetical protein